MIVDISKTEIIVRSKVLAHQNCRDAMVAGIEPAVFQKLFEEPVPPERRWVADDISVYDFTGIEITLPTRLFDNELELQLDGTPCRLIYVGPAHTASDIIVHLPEEGIVFAGDIVFNLCTPIGWEGTNDQWLTAIDQIISLNPKTIVPGHGPLCGVEGANDLRHYLEIVFEQSRGFFERGLSPLEAAKQVDIQPFSHWTEPERLIWSVSRAFREFRGEPWDAPFGDRGILFKQAYELRRFWDSAS